MNKKIKDVLEASLVCRMADKAGKKIGAFFGSTRLLVWFKREKVNGTSKTDRLLRQVIDSKFGDFIRSGKLLSWLFLIPELPWLFLMLSLVGAMALPTLAVMVCSLVTLMLTVFALFYRKLSLPKVNGAIRVWFLFALTTLLFAVVNYGGIKGILAGGIRFSMLPLFLCAWIILSDKKRVWRTLWVFATGTFAISLYGIYQYFFTTLSTKWTDTELFDENFGRLTATFENPNVYGTFLLIAIPIILMAAIFAKGWRAKVFFGISTALATVNMFLTYSRGCYVALFIALAILLFCKGKGWLWAGVGAVALSPLYLPESVLQRIMSIGNLADGSVSYRINIWKGAFAMFQRYWWMGVGIGDVAFASIYQSEALTAMENALHAHNLFLQTACESGVLGLLVLILFILYTFRSGISAMQNTSGFSKWMRLTFVAVWIGLLVQGVTDYIFYNNNLFAIIMVLLGVMVTQGGNEYE